MMRKITIELEVPEHSNLPDHVKVSPDYQEVSAALWGSLESLMHDGFLEPCQKAEKVMDA